MDHYLEYLRGLLSASSSSILQRLYPPGSSFLRHCIVTFLGLYLLTYLDTTSYKKSGRIWKWFQFLSIWKYFRNYFSGSVVLESPLNHDKQYIFCAFPHGTSTVSHVLTMTNCCGMLSEHYKGDRRDLIATVLFYIPILKEMLLWFGCVDANNKTAQYNLSQGRSLYIYIGGEKEQLLTEYGDNKVYTRKDSPGFVRLAMQNGTPLVPMYTFGETNTHYTSKFCFGFRSWLQEKFKIGICLFWGPYWWFPLWPLKTKITVEVGKPIEVPKYEVGKKIPDEEVQKVHAIFEAELVRLFNRTKERNGLKATDELVLIRKQERQKIE